MARYGSPHLGHYVRYPDRPYVTPWMNGSGRALMGLGVIVEQPELRTHPWEIDVAIDPREARAEKWAGAATVVGILAGLTSVAAIMGWIR